jgi:uncharacterized DUF497 family protein
VFYVVVHTFKQGGDDFAQIRIISPRKATSAEARQLQEVNS